MNKKLTIVKANTYKKKELGVNEFIKGEKGYTTNERTGIRPA